MQLGLSSFLLTVLFFALAQVEAATAKRPGIVTLPLTRMPLGSADVHPTVLLQQHINRSLRRYARMTGIAGPSTAELTKRLERRLILASEESTELASPNRDKRYNRGGVKFPASSGESSSIKDTNTLAARRKGKNSNSSSVPDGQESQGFPVAALDALNNDAVTKAENPTAPNSLGLAILANDVCYMANIQAGTPPRNFSIVMDSGSADFWVGGEKCKTVDSNGQDTGADCGPHVFLGPKSSSTFNDTGEPFGILYGTGAVQGTIIQDNVNIAGLALKNHTFGVTLEETDDFTNATFKFDGVMGLASSSLSSQGVLTPVESLAKQGLIEEAIVSYRLVSVANPNHTSEITFGGLDKSKFDPKTLVSIDNVNEIGLWEAPVTAAINGKDLGLSNRTAILDTGTSILLIPPPDAEAIHKEIPGSKSDGQGGYTLPCTTTAVISMTFGGKAFDINATDLSFQPVDLKNLTGDCVSSIAAVQIPFLTANQWLLGDTFLKSVYFSTNVAKNTISLAKPV